MSTSYWRDVARPIIDRVLAETKGKTEKEIRAALRKAYPFHIRKYHPYKIWCDEVARQRGKKAPLPKRRDYGDRLSEAHQKLIEWEHTYGKREAEQ
jgi:hypothetical protein